MADLSKFSTQDRLLIVSLPYRAAMWVSHIDDNEGTSHDDKLERKVVERTINRFASASDKIPVAAAVMQDIKTQKGRWNEWGMMTDEAELLVDAKKAVAIASDQFDEAELNQYREAIWRLAVSVAQAYGEHVDPDNEMVVNNFFSRLLGGGKVKGGAKNTENISDKEKAALTKLKAALKG